MYIGKLPEIGNGHWIGVEYDDPVGKNDGSVKGSKFFECPPKFGGFLRPDKLQVGDFPEEDIFASDDDDDDAAAAGGEGAGSGA